MSDTEVTERDLLSSVKRLMYRYDFLAKRRWGQNFIIDSSLLRRMVSYADVQAGDVVLEIGSGLGFLTKILAEKCSKVIAVEVDRKLFGLLSNELGMLDNVTLIFGDILKTSVSKFNKVVSSPPYSISSPILFWLLKRDFDCAVLTFQEEFAERLVASAGIKKYGRLTVTVSYRADVELLEKISRDAFYPQPKVNSSIVRLRVREPKFHVEDEEAFFRLTRILFSQRRRKIRNAILPFLATMKLERNEIKNITNTLPFSERRVFKLSPEEIARLTNEIVQYGKNG